MKTSLAIDELTMKNDFSFKPIVARMKTFDDKKMTKLLSQISVPGGYKKSGTTHRVVFGNGSSATVEDLRNDDSRVILNSASKAGLARMRKVLGINTKDVLSNELTIMKGTREFN